VTPVGLEDATRVVTDLLGFRPEPTRSDDVIFAVTERLKRRSTPDVASYIALLEDKVARAVEARALADRLTINETYFFREDAHHAVIRDVVAPALRDGRNGPLRILSLGCSSGEEPYGIALTLIESGFTRNDVRIVAVDASAAAIDRAERARFSAWSLRNVDAVARRKYFAPAGNAFELLPEIRSWVRFGVANVVERDRSLFEPESYDVVFCRNILIYFTPDVIRGVIDDVHRALRPGGYFFLGHAETGHAGRRFDVHEKAGAFYFSKRRNSEFPTVRLGRGNPASLRPESDEARSNVVSMLPRQTPRGPEGVGLGADVIDFPPRKDWFDTCVSAIRAERFDEALEAIAGAPASRERDVARAAILTNQGMISEALAACGELAEGHPPDAEVHYLRGLCAELAKRPEVAREEYVRASMLDEDFAMPRLRLGMLARRGRQFDDARRYLRDALRLFPYQTERVLLLFGGGFHVDGLTRLCRTEIDACKKPS